jgi:spore maturation protein A
MLNIIWFVMITGGFLTALFTGSVEAVSGGAVESAKDAISLCITMLGVVGMWSGVMKIAQEAGMVERWAKKAAPIISFLFPCLPEDSPARKPIAVNFIANLLGLGWAATPAGLQAMEALEQLEVERGNRANIQKAGRASNEMCTFLIINISSLQLIPVNMIAYRSQYQSENPAMIVAPGLLATLASTLTAVFFCAICNKEKENV